MVAGIASDRDFNDIAQAAARRHRRMLPAADLDRLSDIPQGPVQAAPGIVLCHGSPQDEDLYLLDGYDARESFQALGNGLPDTDVCFFGHTHVAMILQQERPKRAAGAIGTPVRGVVPASGDSLTLDAGSRYPINPGSVGQPRDGNPDAAFGVFDTGRKRFTQYRVPYPVEVAPRKIRALGLPERLAERLAIGR